MRTTSTFLALAALLLPGPVAAQQQDPELLFYRGYYVEVELQQPDDALALYRQALAAAPESRIAGLAARRAIALLKKQGDDTAAEALAKQHADVLAETVPVGINDRFLDPHADVQELVRMFESESREIFAHRHDIADLLHLQNGEAVADIGAGTGFFSNLFAREVGPEGKVYAVEIGDALVAHLKQLKQSMNLSQMEVVHSKATSSELPEDSIDVAFICDVYHHFSDPLPTMRSIFDAMHPGGRLFVVEFERVPGKSRPWLLEHVRAGKDTFTKEIEAAGFELVKEEPAPWLSENYILHFEKPSKAR